MKAVPEGTQVEEKKEETTQCTVVPTQKGQDWWKNNKRNDKGQFAKKGWKVDGKEEKVTCSLVKGMDIYLEVTPRLKINLMMEKFPYKEWIGYLIGSIDEEGDIYVEDMTVPPHREASGASAEAEPNHHPDRCVGIIHSHNNMAAFHSQTDVDYVDGNYDCSITVAKKNNTPIEWDAITVATTPCGKKVRFDCKVYFLQPKPEFNTEEWIDEAVGNVNKGTKVYGGYQKGNGYVNYGAGVQHVGGKKDRKRGWNNGGNGHKTVQQIIDEAEDDEELLAQMGYGAMWI